MFNVCDLSPFPTFDDDDALILRTNSFKKERMIHFVSDQDYSLGAMNDPQTRSLLSAEKLN